MKNTLGGQFYFSRHGAEANEGQAPRPLLRAVSTGEQNPAADEPNYERRGLRHVGADVRISGR